MTALALIFSYIEVLIPFNFGVPGIKLGIANLAVIIALYRLGYRYALGINTVRVLVAGLLFSGLFGALYSLAGALMSFAVMVLVKKAKVFSVTGVSIAGGVAGGEYKDICVLSGSHIFGSRKRRNHRNSIVFHTQENS